MTEPVFSSLESLPTVCLLGASLHGLTEQQCIQIVMQELAQGRGGSVITMNLDHLRRFLHDPRYAGYYHRARIVTPDGMPLIWASRIQGTPLPERVTGSSLIWTLSDEAARQGRSVYLYGGAHDSAEKTASLLRKRHPALRIAGVSSSHIDLENDGGELERLAAHMAAAAPDIVYVALGSPKQEEMIDRLRDRFPATWWLGVGIAFSFASGELRRAPLWMQRTGLEWSYRLFQEPRRLAKRYLVQGLPFALRLLSAALVRRFRGERNLGNP